ncbi:MAG TPA: hypothetical protein VHB25_04245 [Gemmatimonadaceae bacterium]|nr:hypothetical protein [Gemmatimonadaceae bacterium]
MRTMHENVDTVNRLLDRGVDRVREEMADAAERAMRQTKRAIRRGRHQVERGLDEARVRVRNEPGRALAIAFAAGAVVGALTLVSVTRRMRRHA